MSLIEWLRLIRYATQRVAAGDLLCIGNWSLVDYWAHGWSLAVDIEFLPSEVLLDQGYTPWVD
jgi:hypothetical protein